MRPAAMSASASRSISCQRSVQNHCCSAGTGTTARSEKPSLVSMNSIWTPGRPTPSRSRTRGGRLMTPDFCGVTNSCIKFTRIPPVKQHNRNAVFLQDSLLLSCHGVSTRSTQFRCLLGTRDHERHQKGTAGTGEVSLRSWVRPNGENPKRPKRKKAQSEGYPDRTIFTTHSNFRHCPFGGGGKI